MVAPTVSVTVGDVRPTIQFVEAEIASGAARATQGLLRVAREIQARARANMATHHYDGRAERATTVWTAVRSPMYVSVKVGIRGNTFAPEGKTFEVGWHSSRGLQPPTAPLAEWAIRRGIAHSPSQARSIGYAIARAQGRRGYSFGEFHWLTDAAASVAPSAESVVARYMAAGWASQPRDAGGRFMSLG